MPVVWFAVLVTLLCPFAGEAQATSRREPLGVRFLRGEQLPAPFSLSLVSPTADGLVALTVDDRLAARWSLGREPLSTTEFYLPDDVLQWTAGINTLLAWMSGPMGSGDPPAFTLGASDGVVIEVRGIVANGRREGRFRLNRCRESQGEGAIGPGSLITIASRFRRAALRARAQEYRQPPDETIWYGHAVGCPARADLGNVAPNWPQGVTQFRPHQEIMQFVVDATGRVEPGSERFLASGDPRFAAAIRSVLPSWRFTPARRMSKQVRQVMHLNVGFTPPVMLGPGQACPDQKSKGVVARLAPEPRSRFRPDQKFLQGMANAFAFEPVAEPLHGTTMRFGYSRQSGLSNPRLVKPEGQVMAAETRQFLLNALGMAPALPASVGMDTVELELEFGVRCEIFFAAMATHDAVSMLPQGDGMIRIANSPEVDGRHLVRERGHTAVTMPAGVFRQFIDTVAALLPAIDTTGPVANGPDYAPDAPMFGTEHSLGLNMWLSRTGWIRAGFSCGRPGTGQARFLEVAPGEFSGFRRAALAAAQRISIQPGWTPRGERPYLEHELTCHPVPVGHHPLPTLQGRDPTSVETVLQITVDESGNVDPSGVETMAGLDSSTRALLVASLKRWTFQPAIAGSLPVRAKTHLNLILRPAEADAVVLASLTRELTPDDTLQRTVFYRPTTPPEHIAPLITPNALQRALALFQPYVERARQSWPEVRRRFLAGLPLGNDLVVTTLAEDNIGNSTFALIRVERVVDGVIYGRVWRDLSIASDWKRGDLYAMPEVDLLDWMIIRPDGTMEGNRLGRFLGSGLRIRVP